jgi:hypothetical protein
VLARLAAHDHPAVSLPRRARRAADASVARDRAGPAGTLRGGWRRRDPDSRQVVPRLPRQRRRLSPRAALQLAAAVQCAMRAQLRAARRRLAACRRLGTATRLRVGRAPRIVPLPSILRGQRGLRLALTTRWLGPDDKRNERTGTSHSPGTWAVRGVWPRHDARRITSVWSCWQWCRAADHSGGDPDARHTARQLGGERTQFGSCSRGWSAGAEPGTRALGGNTGRDLVQRAAGARVALRGLS